MGNTTPEEARTVRCEACGSPIPVRDLTGQVTCAHCRHVQVVDPAVLQQLAAYQRRVRSYGERQRRAQQRVAHVESIAGGRYASNKEVTMAAAVLLGIPFLLLQLVGVLMSVGVLSKDAMQLAGITFAVWLPIGITSLFVWYYTGPKRKRQRAVDQAITITCPNCGAPHVVQPGQVLDRCTHCGAALMPDGQAINQGLQSSEEQWRRAELERFRVERIGRSKLGAASFDWVLYLALAMISLLTGGLAASGTYDILFDSSRPYGQSDYLQIAATWATSIGFGLAFVLFVAWSLYWRHRWQRSTLDIAKKVGFELSRGSDAYIGWLNRYWAAPYNPEFLAPAARVFSMIGQARGFPCAVLVQVDQGQNTGKWRVPERGRKLHLMVAAQMRTKRNREGEEGVVGFGPEAEKIKKAIEQRGFAVRIRRAGVMATASEQQVKALVRHPERLAEKLEGLSAMASMLVAMGGKPALPV